MSKVYPLEVVALISALILSMNLVAGSHDHGEHHHQQEAHQHGAAEISLALEGDKVDVMFESPAANIVGFEHVASTPEQKNLIGKASAVLELPDKLFSFVGRQCELTASEIDVSAVQGDEAEEHGHDHHGESDQKSEHDTHSEITAHYQFHCEQGSKLTAVSLSFLEQFPGIEKLKVMWVTDSNQGATELTEKLNTVHLSE